MTAAGGDSSRPIVVARVRPRWPQEVANDLPVLVRVKAGENGGGVVEIEPDGVERHGPRAVQVTHALGGETGQDDVWALFGNYVGDFLDRINLSIFAYGETGSGKTYTMSALTRRFLGELLARRPEYDRFELSISMVEIDNEKIYCLLSQERRPLSIMNYQVKGAKRAVVTSEAECDAVLTECWKRRKTAATEFNDVSSRSHAVCTIKLDASQNGITFSSEAHICDLAGSERSGLSAQDGNPNVSLSLMSMIVKDIVSGCPRNNFRQSKLTHLLQPALTGRCKLGLVFTLNPCSSRGATSSVQFAQNMMKMPDAKIVRNPMIMTEAQLAAASEQLMLKEAAVRVQLESAEQRQRKMEQENDLLRKQLHATHAENLQIIEENKKLAAVLAREQWQSGVDQQADYEALRSLTESYSTHSGRMCGVLEGVMASASALDGTVVDDVRALADMLAHLLKRLKELEAAYGAADHARLVKLLPVAVQEMGSLVSNDAELHELTALVNEGLGITTGSGADTMGHEVDALVGICRGMHGHLVAAARNAQDMAARQARAEELEAEIKRLQAENHDLRTRPLTDGLAPLTPSARGTAAPVNLSQRRPSLQASLYDKALRQHMALIPARHAYEKLAHMCALNRFCANRFLQLGGIDKLVEDGLLSVPPDSPEAATTAEFLPAFCALHDARDRVRRLGGCQALADMLGVPGGPELDETRIRAAAAAAELCVGNNANREFFTSACMGHLMALMAAESQHLQEAAIGALAEMAEGSEACKAAASAHGVVGVLLMATMVHNQRVQVAAARALGRLVSGAPRLQAQLLALELEAPDFDWAPLNGLACLAASLRHSSLGLQVSVGRSILTCVEASPNALAMLCRPDTLELLELDETVMRTRLLLAAAARDCGAVTLISDAETGLQAVTSQLGAAFPHLSLVSGGCWRDSAWGGPDPAHPSYYLNPQYIVRLESPTELSIHLEAQRQGQAGQSVSLDCFAVEDTGRCEVAFANRCPAFCLADNDSVGACLVLPPGCYVVVATLREREPGRQVNFRIGFAAQQEIEVEAVGQLEGWNEGCSGCKAEGSWQGFWKGGNQPSSPFFWRNPQLVLHRTSASSASSPRSPTWSGGSSSASVMNYLGLPPSDKLIVAVHRKRAKGEAGKHTAEESQVAVGLSFAAAVPAPGGLFKRSVGASTTLLGEGWRSGASPDGAGPALGAATKLAGGPLHGVFELDLPAPGGGGSLVLVPFLVNCSADCEFSVNVFSTQSGVQLLGYAPEQEWPEVYTAKARWDTERHLRLTLVAAAGRAPHGTAKPSVALRFPGIQADCAVDVAWRELPANAGADAFPLREDRAASVPLAGSALMFAIAPGQLYEVSLQMCEGAAPPGKVLMVQVFSDLPLVSGTLAKDARVEDIASHLPCPVSAGAPGALALDLEAADGGLMGADSAAGRAKADLSTWGIQAARSRETAKHIKSMVSELKQQVEIMRQTHAGRQSSEAGLRSSSNSGTIVEPRRSTPGVVRPSSESAPQTMETATSSITTLIDDDGPTQKMSRAASGAASMLSARDGPSSSLAIARTKSASGLSSSPEQRCREVSVPAPPISPRQAAAHVSPRSLHALHPGTPSLGHSRRTSSDSDIALSACGENPAVTKRHPADLHRDPRKSLEFMAHVMRQERPRVRINTDHGEGERSSSRSPGALRVSFDLETRGHAAAAERQGDQRSIKSEGNLLGALQAERDFAIAENERLRERLARLEAAAGPPSADSAVIRNPFTGDPLPLAQ